jgi:hypothetical protein
VEYFWNLASHRENQALILSGKLKMLRRGLKEWSKELPKLRRLINNNSYVLALLDGPEE